MQNSQVISILTIFILVFSVTTIALTLKGSQVIFAAKKSKSEEKIAATGEVAPTSSNDAGDSSGGGSSTINPLSVPCPDGSIPVKEKCPPATLSEGTSGTKNKHKSDETTREASTPSIGVGESNSDDGSTTRSKSKEDTTDSSAKSDDSSGNSSTTTPTLSTTPHDSSKDSSSNAPLPSIMPSNQGVGSTDGGSRGGSTDSSSGDSTKPSSTTSGSTDTGSGGSSSGSTSPSTTSGSGTSGGGSSSSSSSSTTTTTKPSNSKIPQTSVSQSAAIAATNQIINSPGSTILNQQSIKQSVRINNEVNNIIRKSVSVAPSSSSTSITVQEKPLTNLITVKLATSTMSRNAYLPIGDVAPYHLIGGHITANLPTNHLYVVVAQLASSNGVIQHAVVLDMTRSQIPNTYETDLGSQISGTNPFTGKQDDVSDITNLFLWNNGNQQVTFSDANAVSMNLIYK